MPWNCCTSQNLVARGTKFIPICEISWQGTICCFTGPNAKRFRYQESYTAVWICQISLSKMKFEIHRVKNAVVLRVEYDYPEGEVEEIAYQETGDSVL